MPQRMPDPIEGGIEKKENHEFTVEEIRGLLKKIEGKEHVDLAVKEKIENIKGELMSVVFSSGEKETIDGMESEITYLLTLAGQRYNKDGTLGRMVSKTFLTKDYDDGMSGSEEFADYVNCEWTNLATVAQPDSNLEKSKIQEEAVFNALNEKGIEDPATKELLGQYAAQCEEECEAAFAGDPSRAHFECALKLARLYGRTEKYKEYAVESLEELLMGAGTISEEMEKEIIVLIESLKGE